MNKNHSDLLDVLVVGAGPAGSSAAHTLASAGLKVAIIEKAALPRYKTCGGGLVYRAIRLLPVELDGTVEQNCFRAELHLGPENLHFASKREWPVVSMTMRDRFDHLLVKEAEKVGAELLTECTCRDVVLDGDRVLIHTNRGEMQARFVVAADGATSMVARKSGWTSVPYLIPALEGEVTVDSSTWKKFEAVARFDFDFVRGGYAWLFPKQDHLSIGVLSMRRGAAGLRQHLERYLSFLGIESVLSMERHGHMIPVRPRKKPFVKNRVILTGDVAGLADALTGEGITNAVRSGQLAGKALIEGRLEEHPVRRIYEDLLSREILSELRMSRLLAKLTYEFPRLRALMMRCNGPKICEALTDVFMGVATYRGILTDWCNYPRLLSLFSRRRVPTNG